MRLFLLLLFWTATVAAQLVALESGKTVTQEILAGQPQSSEIRLTSGQCATISVRQRGIDVVEKLFAPNKQLLAEFDSEARPQGEDKVDFVAETTGAYRLEVESKTKATPGHCEIQLLEIRSATEHDRALFESHRLETQAHGFLVGGEYDEALPLAERALSMGEKELGPDDVYVAQLLVELGDVHEAKVAAGAAPKAKALYERALAICEKQLGADHPRTAEAMRALGAEYLNAGEYPKAEELLSRALNIEETTLGPEHPEVAHSLYSLGLLRVRRGEKDKGEELYRRSLAIMEKNSGTEDKLSADLFNVLAQLNFEKQDYKGAEKLLQEALAIKEKQYGSENLALVVPLQNLGTVVSAEKEYARAEGIYRRVLDIRQKFEGPDNADMAWPLNNLGNLYRSQGDYQKAVETLVRAAGIVDKTATPYQPVTLLTLGSLARNYAAGDDRANAIKTQARVDQIVERNLDLNLGAGSERQKLAFLGTISWRTDRTVSLNMQLVPNDHDATSLAFLVLLQRKGRVLDAMADTLSALRERAGAEDRTRLDELSETTAKLAKFAVAGPQKMDATEYQKQLRDLESEREKLEGEISRRSAQFRAQSQTVTLEAVQASIPNDGALIEFVAYRPFDAKEQNDNQAYGATRYAAYVLRRQGVPVGKDLGAASEIDEAVNAWRAALRDPKRSDARDLGRALDRKVMMPVRSLLGDAARLLVSPDGELNLIPFGALVDEDGHYLIERYSFTYLTSGRDLLRMQVARDSKGKALIVADPSFGEPDARNPRPNVTAAREMSELYFAPLSGTVEEARTIQFLFPDARLLTGAAATESAIRSISSPRILHIATHGFFLADAGSAGGNAPGATRGVKATSGIENPLLRSGLALAGANRRRNGEGDSGILTALEASGLNLWGTKLAVLSACDTGVGEVRNGEGVYGLRRAFVLAGAESLLMSLWPASDYSTRHLMAEYYKNLKEGKGRGESLRQVQLHLLKSDPRLAPYYWANFIQSGEWANLDGQR